MTILQLVALWFLSGCVCAGIWAILSKMARRDQFARRKQSHQLDLQWCSFCGGTSGFHYPDCAFILEVRRS